MAQVNAGRVRFVSRGEYNNSTQYYLFDLVDYNGSSYFAKANTTGNVPTNTTYWQLVAEKGNTGGDGPVGPTGNGITSIVKTASAGLIDTYTITYTNGTTTTFEVTNGQDGEVTQEYVDEENERLKSVFNVLPKVSGSGESVTLENTGDTMLYKMDLKGNTSQEVIQGEVGLEEEDTSIYVDDVNEDKENYITLKGNTYQETTTGKNLFHIDDFNATSHGITLTIKDNTFTLNGTNDGTESVFYLSRTPITTGSSTSIKLFIEGGTATNTRAPILYSYVEWINQVQSNITEDVIKPMSANVTYNRYVLGIKGGTFNNYKFSPMIAENLTSTDTYEPYTNGASPNPDYPQEIEVVTGENVVKVEGKNLFDYDDLEDKIEGFGITGNQENFTITGNSMTYMYPMSLDEQCTISGSWSTTNGNGNFAVVYEDDSIEVIMQSYSDTSDSGTFNFTTNINKKIKGIRFRTFGNRNFTFINLQIEKGSTATPYEPYKGQTYPINLGSIELCKIGTYQDRIYKSNGNWYLHKEVGKIVLDNSKTVAGVYDYSSGETQASKNGTYVIFNLANNYANNTMFDTIAKYEYKSSIVDNVSAQNNLSDNSFCIRQGTNDRVYFKNSAFTGKTGNEIKQLIQGAIVYYVLATPTDTQITDTTLVNQLNALYTATIHSTTHINTETSNLLPYINLKYNVVTASPSPDRASEVEVVTGNNTITISNEDGTKTQSYNLTLGNLELCKIGDYQDYFYKDNGNWYKYGAIGKTTDVVGSTSITINDMINNGGMYSLYGGTLSGKTITYDSALLRQNTIYYPLSTPTQTQITDQLLVSQLDELQKAMSYYDKTLITQTNADNPFILDVVGIRDLQDIFNL